MIVFLVVGIFIAFDIITGIGDALYRGDINSTKLRQGFYHKASEIVAVLGAYLLEMGLKYIDLGIDLHLFKIVSVYICTMELVSIIENLCDINPNLAKLFKPYLEKLKGDKDRNDKTGD